MSRTTSGAPRDIDITVLIPTLDEEVWIESSAAAALGQRFTGELEFLFIDGGSTDGTRVLLDDLTARDPRVRVLENPRRSVPAALNVGLAEARGKYVVRMDAHSVFGPDYVALTVGRLRQGGATWVAGPVAPITDGPGRTAAVAAALGTSLGRGGSRKWSADADPADAAESELDTGVFAGALERETLCRYGGWDESWPVNEDAELAARILADGGRIVCVPGAVSRYMPRQRLGDLARQYLRFGFYRAKTARRHPHALRREHLAAPATTLVTAAALVPGRRGTAPRLALLVYLCLLALASARACRGSQRPGPTEVGLALAVMHEAWGLGFLAGSARFGPPVRAVVEAVSGSRPPSGGRGD